MCRPGSGFGGGKGYEPMWQEPGQGGSMEPQDIPLNPPIVSYAPWHKMCPPLLPRKSVLTGELVILIIQSPLAVACSRTHYGTPVVREHAIWMPA